MADPIIQIRSTGDDTYSGAGPGDGVTSGTVLTGTTAVVNTATAFIGLYDAPDLTNVLYDGSHTIQLNYSTSGKVSLVKITGKYTANVTGTCHVDGDGVTVEFDADPGVTFGSNYPIKIGTEYSRIASGTDATHITLAVAVTPGEGVAYQVPPHVITDATLANMVSGTYSWAIGGSKASLNGTLFRHAMDSGTNLVSGILPGWQVIFDSETIALSAAIVVRVSSSGKKNIRIRGRVPRAANGDESSMTTITFSSFTPNYWIGSNSSRADWSFEDFKAVTNVSGKRLLEGLNYTRLYGVSLQPGTQSWSYLFYAMNIAGITNCNIKANLLGSDLLAISAFGCKFNITSASTDAWISGLNSGLLSVHRCVFISTNNNRILLNNADFVGNVFVNVRLWCNFKYNRNICGNIFYYTASYAASAIEFDDYSMGLNLLGNAYYNATSLAGAVIAASGHESGTVNENPNFVDLANGNVTVGNENLKGVAAPYLIPGTAIQTYTNIGVAQNNPAGGGTTIFYIED